MPQDTGSLPHSRHVFLCFKQPHEWPASPYSFEWGLMPRSLRAAVQSADSLSQRKALLTVCEGRDDGAAGCYNGDVLLFPDMLIFRALTRFDIQHFVEEALLQSQCKPGKGRLHPEPLTGCHVFVCCQSSHGSRCGTTGPKVAKRLAAEVAARGWSDKDVRIWRCCHLTADRVQCEGNVVVFNNPDTGKDPQIPGRVRNHVQESRGGRCDWYSTVRPEDVPDLLETHIVGGKVVSRLWVGSMRRMPAESQMEVRASRVGVSGNQGRGRQSWDGMQMALHGAREPSCVEPISKLALESELMRAAAASGQHWSANVGQFPADVHASMLHIMNQQHQHQLQHLHPPPHVQGHPEVSEPQQESVSLRGTQSCPEERPSAPFMGNSNGSNAGSENMLDGCLVEGGVAAGLPKRQSRPSPCLSPLRALQAQGVDRLLSPASDPALLHDTDGRLGLLEGVVLGHASMPSLDVACGSRAGDSASPGGPWAATDQGSGAPLSQWEASQPASEQDLDPSAQSGSTWATWFARQPTSRQRCSSRDAEHATSLNWHVGCAVATAACVCILVCVAQRRPSSS